ncbi:MAG: CehA/McbA family metallohydrolase [Paracoccus sp. (in: a-proteobacteria)]|uniref:CehA/McbA family metallohydrolase n=1 Tax=Paracoccus sp. TaxID=267 RepID=UPI0026DF371C|nr:CehA/McbA family metallohydrolase [Paracoccus sp. (in: a-proteobacteria)]MDO5631849.1 CehA/McbA family metallohydrolase [Paracoccus sp. (in: a-proteobacteria)]
MFSFFNAPGRFWRGNLHGHSDRSDGLLTPAEVCRRYAAQGYDFTCVTDHFIGFFGYPITDTTGCRRDGFTTLIGAELHSGAMENGELWHILAVGLPPDFPPPQAPDLSARPGMETGPQIARRARDAGAFVAIAHPQWSGMTLADARSIDAAHAVEIYNHGCGNCLDRGEGGAIADLLLSEGRDVMLIATDDSHFTEPDHFGGWVMVKAMDNTPETLLAALKAGHFYASQGPELRGITMAPDGVTVDSSAVRSVIVQGQGSAAASVHGDSLTRTTVPLARLRGSGWLRVTVIDAAGRRAWSNPWRP